MLKFLPSWVRGIFSFFFYLFNTLFWTFLLFQVAFFKLAIPATAWRSHCSKALNWIATHWIAVNNFNQRLLSKTRWDIRGLEPLDPKGWYMVVANHQSWVDILVLQRIFHRKIPFLKFFLKKELRWLPVLGQAWWALDFPFMKRYSTGFLKNHPHLRGKDLEITRKACEKFKTLPVSVMNFVEGTRFTKEKHTRQKSPYANLLRTKAGGMAFVLGAMGERMHRVLDVTIVYPNNVKSFWSFMCGNIDEIRVRVKAFPIGSHLLGDYTSDRAYRRRFQHWLNSLWEEKDRRIAVMRAEQSARTASLRPADPAGLKYLTE